MSVRKAGEKDLPMIASLAAQKRHQYEGYQPVFHKENTEALEAHSLFLKDILSKENFIVLVHETDGRVDGFIVGSIVSAPPVYDPGGKICFVDDFMVDIPALWATGGKELLAEVTALAKSKGAVIANVVCGPLDTAKRDFLADESFRIASEWRVKPIP